MTRSRFFRKSLYQSSQSSYRRLVFRRGACNGTKLHSRWSGEYTSFVIIYNTRLTESARRSSAPRLQHMQRLEDTSRCKTILSIEGNSTDDWTRWQKSFRGWGNTYWIKKLSKNGAISTCSKDAFSLNLISALRSNQTHSDTSTSRTTLGTE